MPDTLCQPHAQATCDQERLLRRSENLLSALLAYAEQDFEDLRKCGDTEEIDALEKVIDDTLVLLKELKKQMSEETALASAMSRRQAFS